jgi:hypothetical protein
MRKIYLLLFMISTFFYSFSQTSRNILIEYSTATNCGYCPCMDSIVENDILLSHPNTSVVAYHNDGTYTDPFAHFYGMEIINAMGIFANPTGFINRGACNNIGFETISYKTDSLYTASPESPVQINITDKQWSPNRRSLTLSGKFTPVSDIQGDIYYNVVITESNLIFYQSGHKDKCFGGENYRHNNVARVVMGGPQGSMISSKDSVWHVGIAKGMFESWPLDLGMVPDNCEVLIFLFKRDGSLDKAEVLQSMNFPLAHGVGIEDNIQNIHEGILNIYPNPATTKVNIQFRIGNHSDVSLDLTDLAGKNTILIPHTTMKPGTYNMEFRKPDIPAGVYIVSLHTAAGEYTAKMVVKE